MTVDPVLYSFINKGLKMSTGKAIAQGQHAAVEAIRLTPADSNLLRLWYRGCHYKKVVFEAINTEQMWNIHKYLLDRDFQHHCVIDEGITEVAPFSFTAIGCALVDKNEPHTHATFGDFQLYREPVDVDKVREEFYKQHGDDKPRKWLRWNRV